LGLQEADRKLAASTSSTGPQQAQEPERLTQSANRNTVENNMRRNRSKKQKPTRQKKKRESAID
jgi:hypothetical protein